jgi:hypothetical protein
VLGAAVDQPIVSQTNKQQSLMACGLARAEIWHRFRDSSIPDLENNNEF